MSAMEPPPVALKWDPKNLEIKTLSVEKTLEPLVIQVTTLVNTKGPSKKKKGRSKRAHVLVAAVERATENFIKKGEEIATENPDIHQEMMAAVDEVRKTGEAMSKASREFAEDPCSSVKRGNMVRSARNLLSAVTRLLILADMVDVHRLLKSLRVVEDDLDKVKNASSQSELMEFFRNFGVNTVELIQQAARRQAELKDSRLRDDLAAARAVLKKNSMMLLTASKVYIRHPELSAAKENRDFVFRQVCQAVNTIGDVAQGRVGPFAPSYEGPGELAAALDDFDERVVLDPLTYNELRTRPALEERLESIISGAALMADSSCTRDERRERIVAECNAVRQALQDLLAEYMASAAGGRKEDASLDKAVEQMGRKTRDLRRQLRKAVVDHVSDSFLETQVPLLVLVEAARAGDERQVEEYARVFAEHAHKLVEVASLACSMSSHEDGVKMVRCAAAHIEGLCPQVVNAARILAARPRSKVAQENMDAFRDAWETQVRLLTEAVDDITTIDDFLAVSENHILEDVNKCVLALQENDADALDRTAGAIRGRSARVCNVVTSEMDNYEPGIYTERVLEAVAVLRDQVMPNFAQKVEMAVEALSASPQKEMDENEFIDASRLVYDGVREIRRAVLMNRSAEELDSETEIEYEDNTYETRSKSSAHTADYDEYPDISGINNTRDAYRLVSEEEKQKIAAQVETFRTEKNKFDREVAKWDDTGNDIIVLAKQMCMIMMEMTDFTRGKGPLKTTMDVINAAKKISEYGTKLDKLARTIADQCPESSTKKDLIAYLQRIALYCRPGATKTCEVCDSTKPHLAHPADYLTDFNNNDNTTWWQSETMLEGIQYPNQVNLTLDLGRAFDITYVRLKFHSMRPESFAIYKRTRPGSPWVPYQYYSSTCHDTYGLRPSTYATHADETRALCTGEYSGLSPLSGGNVAFSTLEGRPSAFHFENSKLLQEWVTATAIRIVLTRLNTFGDEIFGDKQVLRSYYYAIADLAVGGRCQCNGHASACDPGPGGDRQLLCRCEHNTAGDNCERCMDLYNDQAWGRATSSSAHECQPCNCNGRSRKCYFDQDLFERTGHGGHCVNCSDNTDGPNCERCRENYYQRSDGRCIPCGCDPVGSRMLQCNSKGQCPCKPGVEGQRCDRCSANFYDFSEQGCRLCGCSQAGSVDSPPSCNPETGVCRCKANVEGRQCDRCKPGFFNLQRDNEFGCTPCFCFGHSALCQSAPGYSRYSLLSTFTRDKEHWKAADQQGRNVNTRHEYAAHHLAVVAPAKEPVYFLAPDRYLGDQRASYNQNLTFTLRIGEEGPQSSVEDIVLEGAHGSVSQHIFGQGNGLPSIRNQEYRFRLHEDPRYGWNPTLSSREFISILSNLTAIRIRATYVPRGTGFIDNIQLQSAQRSPYGTEAATWVEMCTCPEGYVGQFCESCAPGFRHDPPRGGKFSRCVPCNCNGHALICEPDTGHCICQHNTAGEFCERCAPRYYGNALAGTPDDCQPCPCPEQGACAVLPDESVVCLECPQGYSGRRCDLCFDGHYGDPQGNFGPKVPCKKCECNDNIDPNAVANCNTTTGECLKCVYNTTGFNCDRCLPGHYGDALAVPKGDCKPCDCHRLGSLEGAECDSRSGQCACKANVAGRQCAQCREAYWNLQSGDGCEACNCNLIGSYNRTCDQRTGHCHCRPGVTGKQCDQCLPYHYGFSPDGCVPCDCDSQGSVSLQCAPNGQCECRPNVEGRRCERCKENKYSKESGCVDCPTCYNLVQDAVNEHREKVAELARLLENIEKNPQIVKSVDFEEKLEQVMTIVNGLWKDAKQASGTGESLAERLDELLRRIKKVQDIAGKIGIEIALAEDIVEGAALNMTGAEAVAERIKATLTQAEKYFEDEAQNALKRALERSDRYGQQSEMMSQIARDARQLADQHENDANEIGNLASDAYNMTQEAHAIAEGARSTQDKTENEIYMLKNRMREIMDLMLRTKKMAEEAKAEVKKAYSDALRVLSDAQSVQMPAVDTDELFRKAQEIIEQALRIQKEADELLAKHAAVIEKVGPQREEAEQLLAEAQKQQQITDELLAETDAASAKAKEAAADGERILEEAQKTLKDLRAFDENVKASKEKARVALARVPEIQALIEEAENKTLDARGALQDAEADANAASDIAKEAQRIAQQASQDAIHVRDEADNAKTTARQLGDEAEDLARKVEETDQRMSEFEGQARGDEALAKEALEKANEARTGAKQASDKVRAAMATVNEILRALANVDSVDPSRLDQLERRLQEAEREAERARLDERLAELQAAKQQQQGWMRDYEAQIEQLKRDVANVRDISESLPDRCFRRIKLEP